jgi:hypothetical protein
LHSTLGRIPRPVEKPRCWIRSWRRPAHLLVAGLWRADPASDPSRAPPSRPRFEAPGHRRSIAQGLASQHAEERLQNTLQRGQTRHLELHFGSSSPFARATMLDSFVAQAGASFSGGTLVGGFWAQTRVVGKRHQQSRPNSTRRATGGRLHKVYHANTQRKGFKTSGKGGRIRTLYSTLRGHPRHFEKPRCWIRPSPRAARLLVAHNRESLARQVSLPNDAPSHRRSIAAGLARQHAEERLRNQRQKGQTPNLVLHFQTSRSPF